MKAATPPFATKEPAADEVVEEEAAEVVGEAGEEAVDAPLVGALDLPAALVPPVTPVPPATLAPLATEVNGTGLGVALGPVALRPTE